EQVRSLRAVGQDAAVADGTAVRADEDVGSRRQLGAGIQPAPDHPAPSFADRGEGLGRVALGLVVDVLADARLATDAARALRRLAVAVQDARLGGGRRAIAGSGVRVAAVEDPASEPDDLVLLTGPREGLERAVLS